MENNYFKSHFDIVICHYKLRCYQIFLTFFFRKRKKKSTAKIRDKEKRVLSNGSYANHNFETTYTRETLKNSLTSYIHRGALLEGSLPEKIEITKAPPPHKSHNPNVKTAIPPFLHFHIIY